MKTKVLLVLTTLLTMSLYGQRGVRIGYIDMEYILEMFRNIKKPILNLVVKFKSGKMKSKSNRLPLIKCEKSC